LSKAFFGTLTRHALPEVLELLGRHPKLAQDLQIQGRADLPAAVELDGDGSSIGMIPSFVAAPLPCPEEPEFPSYVLELPRGRARVLSRK